MNETLCFAHVCQLLDAAPAVVACENRIPFLNCWFPSGTSVLCPEPVLAKSSLLVYKILQKICVCSHPRKGPSLRLVRSSTSRADRRPTDSTEFTHSRLSSGHACPEPVLANDSRIIVIVLSVEPAASRRARTSCASRANSRSFEKTVSLLSFPYVCPEPVLVKR